MKEQLSAFIDGELALDQADHLIEMAKSQGEMQSAWQTYHLIGDVMRDEASNPPDLSSRIMAALESEPTQIAPASASVLTSTNHATADKPAEKHSAIWSVAASVAAVMFVGLMVYQGQQEAEQADLMAAQMAEKQAETYLSAHQAHAPSSHAYYIQNVSHSGQ